MIAGKNRPVEQKMKVVAIAVVLSKGFKLCMKNDKMIMQVGWTHDTVWNLGHPTVEFLPSRMSRSFSGSYMCDA